MVKQTKWIVITGGVLSGLGKGVVSASIGVLLNGLKIIPIKCDGYLNVDPGTMNPTEHGEVFVLEDGGEVDLDFGHYERFMNINCSYECSISSGKIFQSLIEKERKGEFLGKTVQVIPHFTGEIRERWKSLAKKNNADIAIIEIGGTVGDLENIWFLEAARELQAEFGRENVLFVHLGFIPVVDELEQQKTKPMQQSTVFLRERGILPEIFIGRSKHLLEEKTKLKLHWLCGVDSNAIISDPNLNFVYELPLVFEREGLKNVLSKKFNLNISKNMTEWNNLVNNLKNPKKNITIAVCGKYLELADAYKSIEEALIHCSAHLKVKILLRWINTEDAERPNSDIKKLLQGCTGIIIPGGFGSRGIEGKIRIIRYARENNIPFLGLCYGLQLAVVEFARNVCGFNDANTTEIDPFTKNPIIDILPEQKNITLKGATMRRGSCKAMLLKNSIVSKLYNSDIAFERHRHRYEVNPKYHKVLSEKGMVFSGISPDGKLVEFIEIPRNRFFVATQAHPELKSRFLNPHPLFMGFVKNCLK